MLIYFKKFSVLKKKIRNRHKGNFFYFYKKLALELILKIILKIRNIIALMFRVIILLWFVKRPQKRIKKKTLFLLLKGQGNFKGLKNKITHSIIFKKE